MSNETLLSVASSASGVTGTPTLMEGASVSVQIQATSYGVNGQVVLKGSADGTTFITLKDAAGATAAYSANTIVVIDRLGQGWQIRADLVISSGTATVVSAVMSTN